MIESLATTTEQSFLATHWLGLLITAIIAALSGAFTALARIWKIGPWNEENEVTRDFTDDPPPPPPEPVLPTTAPILTWGTQKEAYHSTRVVCDEMGLPLQKTVLVNGRWYFPKDIICACIYQESRFLNTAVGKNKDKNGNLLSTDWGLVQVNDTPGWHIGPGLRYSSVQDVLDNPERGVRWMVNEYKRTGKLAPWTSYTSRAYEKHLVPTSPMWALGTR